MGKIKSPWRRYAVRGYGDVYKRKAMGRAPAGCAWVTVMANMNTLAVAALTDTACVILAEGAVLDDAARDVYKRQMYSSMFSGLMTPQLRRAIRCCFL